MSKCLAFNLDSTSDPTDVYPGQAEDDSPDTWVPATHGNCQPLVSIWPFPGYCEHLGGEPTDSRCLGLCISLLPSPSLPSLPLFLHLSLCLLNEYKSIKILQSCFTFFCIDEFMKQMVKWLCTWQSRGGSLKSHKRGSTSQTQGAFLC